MFLRDATAAAAAAAGGEPDGPIPAPLDGLHVRLMGRVVQISHGDDDAHTCTTNGGSGGDDDHAVRFVMDDGTASVHVVVAGNAQRRHRQDGGPPMDKKRPRLLPPGRSSASAAAASTMPSSALAMELELGILVDCVGYLRLVAGMDVPVASAVADAEENQRKDADEDDNEGRLGTCTEQTEEKQQEREDTNATHAPGTKQDGMNGLPKGEESGERPSQKQQQRQQSESSPIYYAVLSAVIVATVSDPDAESLRTVELILAASSPTSSGQAVARDNSDGEANDAIQGIHMAGGLLSKIGAIQHRIDGQKRHLSPGGNSTIHQQPSQASLEPAYSICSNAVFRFIRSAAADGGISEEDLAISLGCISGRGGSSNKSRNGTVRRLSGGSNGRAVQPGDSTEVMAVRHVLQELQADGEIYKTRRGTYLPL
jgi:hypothetical protein